MNGRNEIGWSKLLITQNLSPENGSCSIWPERGQSFETQFTISCVGWADKDSVQNYRYYCNAVRGYIVATDWKNFTKYFLVLNTEK